ncbi:MAG: NAD(+)/NADH kinase [Candidatus Zixiibacteriota bacterium]
MRLGLIVNVNRPEADSTLETIQRWAKSHQWPVVVCARIDMVSNPDFHTFPGGTFPDDLNLVLALGGDGTMLTAVRAVARLGTPVLGVNLGRLGFLTMVPPAQVTGALDRIAAGDFTIEDRLMLDVSEPDGGRESWLALNDVVLIKGGIARLVTFTIADRGEVVTSVAGDGIIVATPTGSTAYALSVGGPIVLPTMSGLVMAPISPHALAHRPMVFDSRARLEITIDSVVGNAVLTVDGQMARQLGDGARVIVTASRTTARLITFGDHSYYKVLREKLHWGIGPELGKELDDRPA